MTAYKITVYLVKPEHERLYANDIEADYYHLWNDNYDITVDADSIDEALEKAAASLSDVPNWRDVTHRERIEYEGRRNAWNCHTKYNEEFEERLNQKYA